MTKLRVVIEFFSESGELLCKQTHDGGIAGAITYVEELKKCVVISSVRVSIPNFIFVTMGGAQ